MAGYFIRRVVFWLAFTTDSQKYPAILAGQPSNKIYVLYCIVLYCVACIELYCIALYCIVLYCIVSYFVCIVLYCICNLLKGKRYNFYRSGFFKSPNKT